MQLVLGCILTLLASVSCSGAALRGLKLEYCVSFWAKNITCYWNPLETDPATTYTLHITEEAGRCQWDFGNTSSCTAPQGDGWCGVPVETLFAFYKIKLTAERQGVQESSPEQCVHGMSIVKLSAPEVSIAVASRSRCFYLEWSLPRDEVLSAADAQYEIQFCDVAETSWTQVNFTVSENAPTFANICRVSPFTNYSIRVRAKYLPGVSFQSGGSPFWSDWSRERFVRTLPAVPSAGPALWRKLGPRDSDGNRVVVLMWKPLKPKEANGEILGYSLHLQRRGEPAIPQCLTLDLHCHLLLPAAEEFTFLVAATNVVGVSPWTKLVVPPSGGEEAPPSPLQVLLSPAGDHSLLLRWSLPSSDPRMGYIIEWGQLPEKEGRDVSWLYRPGSIDHMLITEGIEPGKAYELKVFALADGRIWASGSTSGYSKEIAPLRAPTLYPFRIWKSGVQLRWEILPLEERGGRIRNYTISYEEGKGEQTVVVLDSSAHSYLIEGLAPSSIVRVFLAVANDGGSTEGPVLSIRTKDSDYEETEILFSVLCVGFLFVFLAGSVACLWKHQMFRKYLWPPIPDPAKSNLATWAPQKMCLDFSPCRPEKWSQDYLALTINDLLRVFPSPSEEMGRKLFFGNQWLVDVPGPLQKSDPGLSWGSVGQPQKYMSTWSKVDYSKVIVVQKSCSPPNDPQRSPHRSQPLYGSQNPKNSAPRSKRDQGVWLQNLTYEALLDVGPGSRAFGSTGEFPLLVSLVAVEGVLHTTESPQGTPGKIP